MDIRKIEICVTQDDIDKGIPSSPYFCPIAQALRRIYDISDDAYQVSVGNEYIDVYKNKVAGEVPPVAQEFIRAFDAHQDVEPFCFDIINDYSEG